MEKFDEPSVCRIRQAAPQAARRALEEDDIPVILPRKPQTFGGKLSLGAWLLLAAVVLLLLVQSGAHLAGLLAAG